MGRGGMMGGVGIGLVVAAVGEGVGGGEGRAVGFGGGATREGVTSRFNPPGIGRQLETVGTIAIHCP